MTTEPISIMLADMSDPAGMIGGMLLRRKPITPVIGALTGEAIRVEIKEGVYESPTFSEEARYALLSDTTMYRRAGELMAGEEPVVRISLDLVISRVPEGALKLIISGDPIGLVLGDELSRTDREVSLPDAGPVAVCSSALLVYAGLPIGMATENVYRSLCDRLAS